MCTRIHRLPALTRGLMQDDSLSPFKQVGLKSVFSQYNWVYCVTSNTTTDTIRRIIDLSCDQELVITADMRTVYVCMCIYVFVYSYMFWVIECMYIRMYSFILRYIITATLCIYATLSIRYYTIQL